MKAKVEDNGLLVPKSMLEGFEEVEIRIEAGRIVITALPPDPIARLGQAPVEAPELDASDRHDAYLYS
jgi:hypothetical protein